MLPIQRDRNKPTFEWEGVPFGIKAPKVLECLSPWKSFEWYIDNLGEDRPLTTISDLLATTHPHHFPQGIMQGFHILTKL